MIAVTEYSICVLVCNTFAQCIQKFRGFCAIHFDFCPKFLMHAGIPWLQEKFKAYVFLSLHITVGHKQAHTANGHFMYAGIPWLLEKFKAYVFLRDSLLSDTTILRNKLDSAVPEVFHPQPGASAGMLLSWSHSECCMLST